MLSTRKTRRPRCRACYRGIGHRVRPNHARSSFDGVGSAAADDAIRAAVDGAEPDAGDDAPAPGHDGRSRRYARDLDHADGARPGCLWSDPGSRPYPGCRPGSGLCAAARRGQAVGEAACMIFLSRQLKTDTTDISRVEGHDIGFDLQGPDIGDDQIMGDLAIGDLDRRGSLWRTERRRTERWPALAVACAGGGDPRASARNVRPFILFDARVAEIGAELFPGRGDRRRSDRNVRQRERRLIGTRSARHRARDQHVPTRHRVQIALRCGPFAATSCRQAKGGEDE